MSSYGYHICTDEKEDTKNEKKLTFLMQYPVPGLKKVEIQQFI